MTNIAPFDQYSLQCGLADDPLMFSSSDRDEAMRVAENFFRNNKLKEATLSRMTDEGEWEWVAEWAQHDP